MVEVIVSDSVKRGISNNTYKRHLWKVLIVENKKVKPKKRESDQVISFSDDDYPKGFDRDHNDPMVITATIHNYAVKRILVDQGSLVNILYNSVATSMNIKKSDLRSHDSNLIGFIGK